MCIFRCLKFTTSLLGGEGVQTAVVFSVRRGGDFHFFFSRCDACAHHATTTKSAG